MRWEHPAGKLGLTLLIIMDTRTEHCGAGTGLHRGGLGLHMLYLYLA